MHICAKTNPKKPSTPKACLFDELKKASSLSINNEPTFNFDCITGPENEVADSDIALRANEYTFTKEEIKNAMKIGNSWFITRKFNIQEFEYEILCYH
ncbi:hypothetical protein [Pseudoalteromonas marina]|uniref:Uncharacterized protein n=1 Tax=Pseudoalteromonas marina TaxID=267375 RepID=A0ABT9FI02_9GAMM|nr:hypothetical protein [Pseudoalteromonas marina]MDP2566428.1 hypothetical protein [Pseudoalteromonas marina]